VFENATGRFIDAEPGAAPKMSAADARTQAQEAVKKGAPRDAVNARLKAAGFEPI
jgi:hypothetical protein